MDWNAIDRVVEPVPRWTPSFTAPAVISSLRRGFSQAALTRLPVVLACLSILLIAAPLAAEPVVRVDQQQRSIYARASLAYTVEAADSAIGFGPYENTIAVLDTVHRMPGFVAASSEQSSVIVGDSITARGGTAGSVYGPSPFLGGSCRADSRLFVHLRVETPMGFRLSSRAYCKAQVSMLAWGSSGFVVVLEACEGPTVLADSIIESNGSCDFILCADSLVTGHSGTLPVGEYCLTVRSWINGTGDENQSPEWMSSYEVILVFDARVVGSHPATWTDVKSIYR